MNKLTAQQLACDDMIGILFDGFSERPCLKCHAPLEAELTKSCLLVSCPQCGWVLEIERGSDSEEAAVRY